MSSKKILGWILANITVILAGMWWLMDLKKDTEHILEKIDEYGKANAISYVDLDDRIRYLERLRMGTVGEADEGGEGTSSGDHP